METSCTQSCQRIVTTLLLLLPFFAVVSTSKAAAAAAVPIATIAAPAFALDSIVEMLPTNTVALEVQFGAYLAALLGTFLSVLFLINLYIQTVSRKAGRQGGQDSE
jgi:photosystem II PsbM protein